MSIVNPITRPLTLLNWIKPFLVHPSISAAIPTVEEKDAVRDNTVKPYVDPNYVFSGAFLKTFGADGYVSPTTELVSATGETILIGGHAPAPADDESLSLSFVILTLLGLPNRPPADSWRQYVRNLFGGWDSIIAEPSDSEALITLESLDRDYDTHATPAKRYRINLSGKRLWNVLALPIKLFVILPLKIIGIPFKIALNLVKLVTEFLPEVILNYTGKAIGYFVDKINKATELGRKYRPAGEPHLLKSGSPWWQVIIGYSVLSIPIAILGAIHYAARIFALVGTAVTSPEKSARSAWEYGRALDSTVFGIILGGLGATLSIALTTVMWIILLPLMVSEILVIIPQLVPVLTAISHWPIVASSLTFIQGTFALVVGSLPAAFATAASAVTAALGITVNATVLAVAATVAVIAGPVTTIASRLADELSNAWARWKADTGLVDAVRAALPKRGHEEVALEPSKKARHYGETHISDLQSLLDDPSHPEDRGTHTPYVDARSKLKPVVTPTESEEWAAARKTRRGLVAASHTPGK